MKNLNLPDMPEQVEGDLAYSLIIESMRLEYKRWDSGILAPKVVEPLAFLFFACAVVFFSYSDAIGDLKFFFLFLSMPLLIFYLVYVLKVDIAAFRQAHLAKLISKINPRILKDVHEKRFKEVKKEINYSVFFNLEGKDIARHLAALKKCLKWKRRLVFWSIRYSVLSMGAFMLSKKLISGLEIWLVLGLLAFCVVHIYVLSCLGRSPALLKKSLNFYNKKINGF